jgi:hypothetical protein
MDVLQNIFGPFLPQIQLIVVLIGADLLGGIFSALKAGAFQWAKVADFYRTNVVPKLGGYIIVAGVTRLAGEAGVGAIAGYTETATFALVVAALAGSIIGHIQYLLGVQPAFLSKVGVPPTG